MRGGNFAVAGQGQFGEQFSPGQNGAVEAADGDVHGLADLMGLVFHHSAEQGAAGNDEGEAHHFGVHVNFWFVGQRLPTATGVQRGIGHDLGIRIDALGMERGLHEAALAAMNFAFAGEKTFTENDLGALQRGALGEVGIAGDEDIANVVGIVDQIILLAGNLEGGNVAILARELR